MILKSETYHFHRLDLTRQGVFIVTVYDEDGLRLAETARYESLEKPSTFRHTLHLSPQDEGCCVDQLNSQQ